MTQTAEKTTWLTRQEAASRGRVNIRTVDAWLAAGLLTRHRIGRKAVRIDLAELELLLSPTPDPACVRNA